MNKYILEIQRRDCSSLENDKIKIIKKKIEADYFLKTRDETFITEENISMLKKFNEIYKVGDIFYGPYKKISFYKDGLKTESFLIFADPYYKLYQVNFGIKKLIDTHETQKKEWIWKIN